MLYRQHIGVMMAYCMRQTRDEQKALEIVNAGFLRVFQKIEKYSGTGSLQGWIRKIIYHEISNHFAKQKNYAEHVVLHEDENWQAKESVMQELFYDDLLALLEKLPPKSARVFKSFVIDGFSHKEIAEHFEISIGTSKWHVAEAKKLLQQLILQQREAYG